MEVDRKCKQMGMEPFLTLHQIPHDQHQHSASGMNRSGPSHFDQLQAPARNPHLVENHFLLDFFSRSRSVHDDPFDSQRD
jgi:hypothetical protein